MTLEHPPMPAGAMLIDGRSAFTQALRQALEHAVRSRERELCFVDPDFEALAELIGAEIRAGVFDYLNKPFEDLESLEAVIGKPRDLTVQTGLDALSHSLESLWNKSANPISMAHAVQAARAIIAALPLLASDLRNIELREKMARASSFAPSITIPTSATTPSISRAVIGYFSSMRMNARRQRSGEKFNLQFAICNLQSWVIGFPAATSSSEKKFAIPVGRRTISRA